MRRLKDKLIYEAIDFYKIDSMLEPDPEENVEEDYFEDDLNFDDIFGADGDDLDFSDIFGEEEFDGEFEDEVPEDSLDEELPEEQAPDFEEDSLETEEDPDKQGMIRTVRGAYLVYKRVTANNNYEELWVYNTTNIKSQTKIKNDILAGTDIDPVKLISQDGSQRAITWSRGNVQFITLTGLPN